jgi:myosin heavy subunit
MKNLALTQSRYVRCVKPNVQKKPAIVEHLTTIGQLRSAGVVSAVTISRAAYPNRLEHRGFIDRFKVLKKKVKGEPKVDETTVDHRALTEEMATSLLEVLTKDGKQEYAMGKSKIYFKMGALEFQEGERMKIWDIWAFDIQRVGRGYNVRKKFVKPKPKGPIATKIQAWYKMCVLAKAYRKSMKDQIKARKKLKKQGKAAVKIQCVFRSARVRPQVKEMIKAQKAVLGMKNKVKDLEVKLEEVKALRRKDVQEAKEAGEQEMLKHRTKAKKKMSASQNQAKMDDQMQTLVDEMDDQMQTLVDESGQSIAFLRKKNGEFRHQNEAMRKDFRSLKENNTRLMEANSSASASFEALNEHAKNLNNTNAKLIKNGEAYTNQLEKLSEDLATRQQYYLAEAESRLQYQKTMAQVVASVQDQCRDASLVEEVVLMALQCDATAKNERDAVDSNINKKKNAEDTKKKKEDGKKEKAAKKKAAPKKKKKKKKVVESDSDSSDSSDSD